MLCLSSAAFTTIHDDLKKRITLSNLYIIATYVFWTEIWIFYIIFFMKRSKMFKFLNYLDKLINRNQGHDLQRLSKRMVVLIVSTIPFSLSVLETANWDWRLRRIAFGVFGGVKTQTLSYCIMIFVALNDLILHLLISTPAFTLTVYVYFHRLVIHAFVNYFDQLLAKQSKRGMVDNRESYANLEYLTKISSVFEQLFSFFPCLNLISSLFLSSSHILLQLKEPQEAFAITLILYQVSRLLIPIILILMITRNQDRLVAAGEKTVSVINKNDNRDIWLMKEIMRVCKWKATVFSMIDLDRNLIPSFAGALLTFSVLFLQISNDVISNVNTISRNSSNTRENNS